MTNITDLTPRLKRMLDAISAHDRQDPYITGIQSEIGRIETLASWGFVTFVYRDDTQAFVETWIPATGRHPEYVTQPEPVDA